MRFPARAHEEPGLHEQLLALPDNLTGEIMGGEIHAQPRPTCRYAEAESGPGASLLPPLQRSRDGPCVWWIVAEPETHYQPFP